MKRLLCMVLCLAMVVSMMVVTVSATTRLVYNTPVVNDTYEDGTTSAFTWTTAHKSSGIVSGTGFNGKANYNDPGSKYMNFFSNLVTQATLDANKDSNINFISGLKSYMTSDINYISFDFSSANIARNIAIFLDSNSEYNLTVLPALLFRTAGNYYAGTHANLKPWSYYNTKGFLNTDYHNALGSALGSYSGKEWYNVKFVVDNTSDTDNVSIYVNNCLVNTVSYNDYITCDSAEPKSINELKQYGLRVRGAKKGPDSVEYGIKFLQSLEQIIIDPKRCPNAASEFYSYELEKDSNGEFKATYPDKNNHCIDAIRYALENDMNNRSVKIASKSELGLY
ncbi:MAG: terminase large subunit [Clostridia bacterium]|nr:terminase large subunit [Clostridia bacterium]